MTEYSDSPNESPNESEQERNYILGAFVNAQRIRNKKLHEWTLIKLTSITVINGCENEEATIFFTYKDCSYWVPISVSFLRAAINCFIFTPERHWEVFSD